MLINWKRLWCWEGLGTGKGDDRGWDDWMALPTRCTWVWVISGSWWWTGRPGVLWFMGSQKVGHDWATERNWLMQLLRKGINGSQETILAQPGTCYSRLASFPFLTGEVIFCHRKRVNGKCKRDLWCQLYTRQSALLVLYSLIKFLCKPLNKLLTQNQIWGSWQ